MNFGKAALRVTKNYTKGYSDTQAKVREATSNDPWGPSGTQMNEIAQLTYNQNDFIEIMEMLDKRLNDKGKNWRHVFKSLTVLDYLLHQGSENVVIYFRDNIYIIKTLKEFQFIDEEGKDQGANVRQKAKDITNLLQDEDRLREERRSRASMRDRMIRGVGGHYDGADDEPEDENAARRRGGQGRRGGGGRDETDELKKAIEESKKSLAQEVKKREEDELKEALKLSEQEELKRQKDVDNSNAQSLFDDQSSMPSPFPRADPTPYAVGLQPQMTSLQPQFTAMPMQPQFTSFNPYQQQAEQEAAQQEFLRQQQMFMLQQQQAQQQQQQQEEWMRQQMMQQQQQQQMQLQQQQQQQMMTGLFPQTPQIQVQPTGFGSNNPFAPSPSPSPSSFSQQSNNNSANSRNTTPSFNLQGTYDNHNPSNLSSLSSSSHNGLRPESTPSPSNANVSANPYTGKAINVKTRQNLGENERQLEHLFANRDDGQDTFGNVGAMRYGYTDAGRAMVAQQKTGNNPFAKQQQQQQNNDKPFFDI